MNILIAQFAHISPSTKIFDKYLRNAFKGQKKIDLVVLGEYVANKFFKEYRTKSTLKRELEANKKYFLGLAKKYKTTIVAPVIEWEKGKIYKSILVASENLACGTGNSPLGLQFRNKNAESATFCHSERSEESQKKLQKRDSSPVAQNDNLRGGAESSLDSVDSVPSKQGANSSIFDEKSGLCSCERENRTKGSLTKRATNLPDLSQKDDEFANLLIYRATRLMNFPHWNEASFFNNTQKAQEPLIFSVGGFKVGVIFGWEAHFDEIMIALRKKGVDILCVPCANTFGSNARWQRLMQTRAFLNSCVVVRVNRTGEFVENERAWEFYGESFIALPDGSLGDMMGEKEGILISEIEKENLEKIKNLWQFR